MNNEDNTIGKIVDVCSKGLELAQQLSPFFRKVLGEPLETVGGIMADWAAFFRYKNLLVIGDRLEEIHYKRQLEGKSIPIPPRYAIPLIQAASMENDPDLREMWAGLIANATDPSKSVNLSKLHIETLKSLEPLDALIMEYLYKKQAKVVTTSEEPPENSKAIAKALSVDVDDVQISLQNLYRLGCLLDTAGADVFDTQLPYTAGLRVNNPRSNFRLSNFGKVLYEACQAG